MGAWLRVFRQGWRLGVEDFGMFWNWRTWFGAWMLRIGSNAAIWVLVGQLLGSAARREFLLVGNAVAAGATAAVFAVPASTWHRWDGTYPLLVIGPSSLLPAVLGRTSVWLLNAIATSLATFALLGGAFGLAGLGPRSLLGLPPLVTGVCASSYGLALFLGALVNLTPRLRNVIQLVAANLLLALCGASVPLEFWPGWVQGLANALPMTHGLAAIRILLAGGDVSALLWQAALEAAVGSGWLAGSLLAMDRLADRGRANGSIEFG